MKKLLLLLLALGVTSSLSAQKIEKNIFGIHAGINLSSASISGTFLDISPSSKLGFHAGISYQRLLLSSKSLYLETGIYFVQKGMIQREKQLDLELSLLHIQVPILVNYRMRLGSNFAIIPVTGLYYSYGIDGNYKLSGTTGDAELDKGLKGMEDSIVYGEKGELKRSNFGLRVGLGFDWKRINIALGYEHDMLNTSKVEEGVNDNASTRNKALTLSVGYRF